MSSEGEREQMAGEQAVLEAWMGCLLANADPWSTERLHLGEHSRKNVVAGPLLPYFKDLALHISDVHWAVLGRQELDRVTELAKRSELWAEEIDSSLKDIPVEEWVGFRSDQLPERRRNALGIAVHRGKIRARVDPRGRNNQKIYCLADAIRVLGDAELLVLRRQMREEWESRIRPRTVEIGRPTALPGRLESLARRLRLLRVP